MTQIHLGGRWREMPSAELPMDDPAIQFGAAGFFETMRVEGGRVHLFQEHLDRLGRALERWRIAPLGDPAALLDAIAREVDPLGARSPLRLRLTAGPAPGAPFDAQGRWPVRAFLQARPLDAAYRTPLRDRQPLSLTVERALRLQSACALAGFKSTQYYLYWEARRRARAAGHDDALLLNERGDCVEASAFSLFWMRGGQLFTPPASCGGLPGVFAGWLGAALASEGVAIEPAQAPPEALADADAVFLTNALAEVMPVARIDGLAFTPLAELPLGRTILEVTETGRAGRGLMRIPRSPQSEPRRILSVKPSPRAADKGIRRDAPRRSRARAEIELAGALRAARVGAR